MPELPDRINGEIIEAEHMNAATIRSVQRYTSAAQRDSLNPVPQEGQPAWLSDVDKLTLWTGSQWVELTDQRNGSYLLLTGGALTGDLEIGGTSGINYSGSGSSNFFGFKWTSGRVTARIDNTTDAELALLSDTARHYVAAGPVGVTLTSLQDLNQDIIDVTVSPGSGIWLINVSGYIDAGTGTVDVEWSVKLRFAGGSGGDLVSSVIRGVGNVKAPFSITAMLDVAPAAGGVITVVASRSAVDGIQIVREAMLNAYRVSGN